MLLSSAPRSANWTGFITDLSGWHHGTRQQKAEMAVAEWMQLYEGQNAGPLDRQPRDTWIRTLLEVGYFEADHSITEQDDGTYEERLTVHIDRPPRTAPDLYRVATEANARRFSWLDNTTATVGPAINNNMEIWRCRNPHHVFGTITTLYHLRPGTKFWETVGEDPRIGELDNDYTEWIIVPGKDVCAMTILDYGPETTDYFLSPGRAA